MVGYEPLAKVNTKHLEPPPDITEITIDMGDTPMPHLYIIRSEPQSDRWVLFTEIQPHLKPPRTKDSLAKSLGQQPSTLFREMKSSEFQEMVQCTSLGGDWHTPSNKPSGKPHKITLVKYGDNLKRLLHIETVTIPTD